jgi:hypothetical protein
MTWKGLDEVQVNQLCPICDGSKRKRKQTDQFEHLVPTTKKLKPAATATRGESIKGCSQFEEEDVEESLVYMVTVPTIGLCIGKAEDIQQPPRKDICHCPPRKLPMRHHLASDGAVPEEERCRVGGWEEGTTPAAPVQGESTEYTFASDDDFQKMTHSHLLNGLDAWICTRCKVDVSSLRVPCQICNSIIPFVPLQIDEYEIFAKSKGWSILIWMKEQLEKEQLEKAKEGCRVGGWEEGAT